MKEKKATRTRKMSLSTRWRISEALKGRTLSKAHRRRISIGVRHAAGAR